MRIIQVISGTGRGGTHRVAFCLSKGLREAGHEVINVINPEVAKYQAPALRDEVSWTIRTFRGFPLRTLLEFNRRYADADLVLGHHSHSRHFAIFAKMLGLRTPLWFFRHCISGTFPLAVQWHRRHVDHEICVSEIIQKSVIKSGYPADHTSLIYAGVNLAPFRSPDPAEVAKRRAEFLSDLPPGGMAVGIVARMTKPKNFRPDRKDGKGYDVLFKALAQVRFPYRVLIVGPCHADAHDALRQMAAYHGANPEYLRFVGFLPDISSIYPLMDVNVLPSREEGLGLAVVEGMAAGVATVGSYGAGIMEIIRHEETGLLFEEGDTDGLAACLDRLAANVELRTTIARQCQEGVMARFDAPVMLKAFRELLARKFPGARQPSQHNAANLVGGTSSASH